MSTNTNKRIPIKWIRDGAKSAYDKKDSCYICDETQELELHHTNGLTNLLNEWAKRNKIDISTDEAVLAIRDRFITEHHKQLYEDVFTLCAIHHAKLHAVYGKSPALSTSEKQVRWVHLQKEKHNGILPNSKELGSREVQPSTNNYGSGRGESGFFRPGYISVASLREGRSS